MNMMTMRHPAPFLLPAVLLARGDPKEIGAAVQILIDQIERLDRDLDTLLTHLDRLDGDLDLEDDGTAEPDGTGEGDQSWPENAPLAMSMVDGQYYEDAEDGHDREADHSDQERLTWPERIYQPWAMDGGLVFRDHDDDELHFSQELIGGAIVAAPLNWEGGQC
jgi:hypothetical protein